MTPASRDGGLAREISYSGSARTRAGRAVIRSVENLTGRPAPIRRAAGHERETAAGRDVREVTVERFGLELALVAGSFPDTPRDGPLVVVANHPYGILDGLMMGLVLSRARGDFRILAKEAR